MFLKMILRFLLGFIVAFGLCLLPAPVRAAPDIAVAEPFADYYATHQGIRVLGYPLTGLIDVAGYPAQYFEKGRIEDHSHDTTNVAWMFMYGRLTSELMEHDPLGLVNATDITYAELSRLNAPRLRQAPPAGFTGGVVPVHDGMFVPYDSQLRPAPGYAVAPYFWAYINRADLFSGGWLHDIGLPMSDTFTAVTVKAGERRTIFMQAFERTILTYDMRNPAGWQVERGNIGADRLSPQPAFGNVIVPAAGAQVMLPLHMLVRTGQPGERVTAVLHWADGTQLSHTYSLLRGEDGHGLLIDSLNWMMESQPPEPSTQMATFEIVNTQGVVLARQVVTVLSPYAPNTQIISLYWVGGDQVMAMSRRIPATIRIGTAALEELLWGPTPPNLAGFTTALPTPQQVLNYPGRQANWGPRVTLRSLTITNGVATADFSRELAAYGGGSLRVMLIRKQITQTLLQFPSVHTVRIAIEGQTEGVLEP